MKKQTPALMTLLLIGMFGCNGKKEDEVVDQLYVHKYGYTVSKEEWSSKNYPGQVITTRQDGVTVTATYEDGKLNGPSTETFPHSQTVETHFTTKEILQKKFVTTSVACQQKR